MYEKELKLFLTGLSIAGLLAGCVAGPANDASPSRGSAPKSVAPSG